VPSSVGLLCDYRQCRNARLGHGMAGDRRRRTVSWLVIVASINLLSVVPAKRVRLAPLSPTRCRPRRRRQQLVHCRSDVGIVCQSAILLIVSMVIGAAVRLGLEQAPEALAKKV